MAEVSNGILETANEDASTKKSTYSFYPQIFAGIVAGISMLSTGMVFSWPSFALPKLLDTSLDFHITSDEMAWIIAGLQMGACSGPIATALLVNRIGRKWFLYGCAIPYLVSWLMMYLAQSFAVMFVARFISGLSVGGVYSALPMYLSEIAEVRVRGAIGFILTIMLSTGILLSYIIGAFFDSTVVIIINVVPLILFLLLFFWLPETPYYYLRNNQRDRAKRSLKFLRQSKFVDDEVNEIADIINKESSQKGSLTELLTVRSNRKATFITVLLVLTQQTCGMAIMLSYTVMVFEAANTNMAAEVQVILTSAISFVVGLAAATVVDRFGKKPLFIISASGTVVAHCTIAIFFLYKNQGGDVQSIGWILLTAVLLFYISYYVGVGPVPFSIISEIYPTSVKAYGTMVASCLASLLGVVMTKLFQRVAEAAGYHTIFFILSGTVLILMSVAIFVMPETKGKTFTEIQEILDGKSFKSKDVKARSMSSSNLKYSEINRQRREM